MFYEAILDIHKYKTFLIVKWILYNLLFLVNQNQKRAVCFFFFEIVSPAVQFRKQWQITEGNYGLVNHT